ncbi:NMT1/THI5 like domain protein [Desulfarculus baarsii DSM 2075]|uniref:Thiamine pyrimidine synthase n=1 Tax=Desulfarculus baarsii (strain ATCC 33931 / DSM 2075 / LMG 7858 / VKM B-1802 / 2st14) TaxID=644282 RepID=E1QLV1_DESB2|nr:ABC transporter substrate-binding protein [Desulfarculus baarsii]ADK86536.1 NMT1/THI5 like domain protein [Desulfarculus baarsii DSM 2075]
MRIFTDRRAVGAAKKIIAGALLTLAALSLAGQARAADKVRLQLMWVHQAQFAGLYMAQDHGLYRQAGLDVEFLSGGPGLDPLARLGEDRCDFAVAWLSAAMAWRDRGLPVVNLAQIVQQSSVILVARAGFGVKKIADLNGRLVGLWGAYLSLAPRALLKKHGVQADETLQGSTVALLTSGAAAAVSAMRYNEYHALYQAGVDFDEMIVFDANEAGLSFPEDGLYCLASTWRDKPDVCRRFTQASLAGWRLAFERPEEALRAVMARVEAQKQATNQSHQQWMLTAMRKLIEPAGGPKNMGRLDPEAFQQTGRSLREQGLLERGVSWESFAIPAWRTDQ